MTWHSRSWDLTADVGAVTVQGTGSHTVDQMGLHLATARGRRHRAAGSMMTAWLASGLPDAWTCTLTSRLVEGALSVGLRIECGADDLVVLFTPLRQRLAISRVQGNRLRRITTGYAECDAFMDVDVRVTCADHRVRAAMSNASASRVIATVTSETPQRLGLAVMDGHASFSRVSITDPHDP